MRNDGDKKTLAVQVITGEAAWLPLGAAAGFGLRFAIGGGGK